MHASLDARFGFANAIFAQTGAAEKEKEEAMAFISDREDIYLCAAFLRGIPGDDCRRSARAVRGAIIAYIRGVKALGGLLRPQEGF